MLVRRCDGHRVNQTAACVYSDVAFHSEFPFIALFRLVHFRIPGFLHILGGAGSIDDGGVYNGATLHHVSCLHQTAVDRIEKQLVQTIRFQKMAEFAQCCFIRHSQTSLNIEKENFLLV